MAFSEARRQGFSPGTPVSSPPSSANGSVNRIKLKYFLKTLSDLIAEMSLRTTRQATQYVARDNHSMCCT